MTKETRIKALAEECCRFLAEAFMQNCEELSDLLDETDDGKLSLSHAITVDYKAGSRGELSNRLTWARKSKVEATVEIPNPDQQELFPTTP